MKKRFDKSSRKAGEVTDLSLRQVGLGPPDDFSLILSFILVLSLLFHFHSMSLSNTSARSISFQKHSQTEAISDTLWCQNWFLWQIINCLQLIQNGSASSHQLEKVIPDNSHIYPNSLALSPLQNPVQSTPADLKSQQGKSPSYHIDHITSNKPSHSLWIR